jgi:hypothetical protein
MPRDQETSIGHDPATSDDPLFRSPGNQDGDPSLRGHGDPLRDPLHADADGDDTTTPGATPIGDTLTAGRHADGDQDPSDTPGEWVAGTKGPGPVQDRERDRAVVPDQPGQPSVESTDPVAGDPLASDTGAGARTGTRATMDPDAPDTSGAPGTEDARATSEDTRATSEAPAATEAASDLRTTHDPEVAPDSTFSRDSSAPADPNTPTTSGPTIPTSTTENTEETPATPVPGAPGTGDTTGVQAASAALVAHGAELHDDWARIQSAFVDDPRGSVSQAADLVSQVTSSLVTALHEREQTLRGAWDSHGDQGPDTENLRNALRDYRAFFEMLTKV